MDKLTREAREHGKIIESMVFFENFLKAITSNDLENYSERLHTFSDEYIVDHFRFEEQEVFPLILEQGGAEEEKFIQELLEDHEHILASLAEFKKIISACDPKPTREEVKHIIKSSETVISKIILHARKEDKRLFPALKKM